MPSILAVGNTITNSTVITVTADAGATLTLTGPGGSLDPAAALLLQKQDSSGNWSTLYRLSPLDPVRLVVGTGSWRGVRVHGNCGLDQD